MTVTQPLSEIIRLHRRAEAHGGAASTSSHPSPPSSSPSSNVHASGASSDESDGGSSSDDEVEVGKIRPGHPAWEVSDAGHSDQAAHELDGNWHHPSLRKVLPREAIIAIVTVGTFIIALIVFGIWWGQRKKRLAEAEERAWREIEDETERAKAIARAQERERERDDGWKGRVRRSMHNVRHSFGDVLHHHHHHHQGEIDKVVGNGYEGGGRGVRFAPETRGGR